MCAGQLARAGSFEVTPMEIDLIFNMFADKATGRLAKDSYLRVIGSSMDIVHYRKIQWDALNAAKAAPVAVPHSHKSASELAIESIINFGLGAVAGGTCAFVMTCHLRLSHN